MAARTRFIAPPREAVVPTVFDHPIYAAFQAHRDLFAGLDWPDYEALNERIPAHVAQRFVVQDDNLLKDGLHYESRIHDHARIPTRAQNWHDLFNALIWIEHAPIKLALNRRQVQDIAQFGPSHRSRAQCALTHFDEAGVVVWAKEASLIEAWDQHDWRGWFGQTQAFTDRHLRVHVFGHALMEHSLIEGHLATAKALVICGGDPEQWHAPLAAAIERGDLLNDPQELRPLPLAGLPMWSPNQDDPTFFDGAMFRPLREGRRYPAPLLLDA